MRAYSAGCAGLARRFEGRTALMTGGSSGISRATAQRLAAEGASLVLLGHDADHSRAAAKELTATGASVVFRPLDLRDDNAIASVATELRDRLDAIHVLVNSADVVHINGCQVSTFTDGGVARRDDVIGVNLSGCAARVNELQPLLIAGRCVVANMSSEGAFKARTDHDRPRRAGIRRPPGRQVQSPVPGRSRFPLLFRPELDLGHERQGNPQEHRSIGLLSHRRFADGDSSGTGHGGFTDGSYCP